MQDCSTYLQIRPSLPIVCRNDITTLALYGHGSETILFYSMGHGKGSSMKPLTAPIGRARSAAPGIYFFDFPPNYYI